MAGHPSLGGSTSPVNRTMHPSTTAATVGLLDEATALIPHGTAWQRRL